MDIKDLMQIVPLLAGTGKLDYISTAAETNYERKSATHIIPSHYFRPGQFADLSYRLKQGHRAGPRGRPP